MRGGEGGEMGREEKGQETGRTRGPEKEECCVLEGRSKRSKGWTRADLDSGRGAWSVTSKLRGFREASTSYFSCLCASGISFLILKI